MKFSIKFVSQFKEHGQNSAKDFTFTNQDVISLLI